MCVNWFCCDGVIVGWQDYSDFNGKLKLIFHLIESKRLHQTI